MKQLEPGLVIASYRVVRALGAGGTGAVYGVEHVTLDRDVAALYGVQTKEINQAIWNNPGKFRLFARYPARFTRLWDGRVFDKYEAEYPAGLWYTNGLF